MEEAMAPSAQRGILNRLLPQSRLKELQAIRERQVEMGAPGSARPDREPVNLVPVPGESGNNFGADLEAAGTDRRADDG